MAKKTYSLNAALVKLHAMSTIDFLQVEYRAVMETMRQLGDTHRTMFEFGAGYIEAFVVV